MNEEKMLENESLYSETMHSRISEPREKISSQPQIMVLKSSLFDKVMITFFILSFLCIVLAMGFLIYQNGGFTGFFKPEFYSNSTTKNDYSFTPETNNDYKNNFYNSIDLQLDTTELSEIRNDLRDVKSDIQDIKENLENA